MNICSKCGLPKEACVCEDLAIKNQKITIKKEKRKFGKIVTIIAGLEEIDTENFCRKLKTKLACGGRVNKNEIELQGDHINKIKKVLIEEGFNPEQITI